ncbi:hypothetical protein AG1IA_06409 [Rhizoctonia solani AG-1 IA]|uniref:Uncharacterized protein n=1 Tax=Thanatephorus cucumeris (strain AG1-IA) TaxID=983506 RepID=L8WS37_THACA|nr:hypothetical protein AG1IA_06409 [Rhizoctonia solani AG-1 IA]
MWRATADLPLPLISASHRTLEDVIFVELSQLVMVVMIDWRVPGIHASSSCKVGGTTYNRGGPESEPPVTGVLMEIALAYESIEGADANTWRVRVSEVTTKSEPIAALRSYLCGMEPRTRAGCKLKTIRGNKVTEPSEYCPSLRPKTRIAIVLNPSCGLNHGYILTPKVILETVGSLLGTIYNSKFAKIATLSPFLACTRCLISHSFYCLPTLGVRRDCGESPVQTVGSGSSPVTSSHISPHGLYARGEAIPSAEQRDHVGRIIAIAAI